MRIAEAPAGAPLLLAGDPFARGLAQARARPDRVPAVRAAVALRLAEVESALARSDIRSFLAAQRRATERLCPERLEEIAGLARGFGIEEDRLFAFLHASTIADLVEREGGGAEGCTAFALRTGEGALLAKNRDYRAEHRALQEVMLHRPEVGPAFLAVGSLGVPGCFSSGVNAAGLALADTAVRSRDLGPGLHRYFLLTLLLERCATVEAALALIAATPQTGGGCLVLADASGAVAAVELGHARLGIERPEAGRIARTNHHRLPETAPAALVTAADAAAQANSRARLEALGVVLARLPEAPDAGAVATLLARHADGLGPAFCRHGGADLAATISGAVFDCVHRRLLYCAGPPCSGAWRVFDLEPRASGSRVP